jgi:hypothetical protein
MGSHRGQSVRINRDAPVAFTLVDGRGRSCRGVEVEVVVPVVVLVDTVIPEMTQLPPDPPPDESSTSRITSIIDTGEVEAIPVAARHCRTHPSAGQETKTEH